MKIKYAVLAFMGISVSACGSYEPKDGDGYKEISPRISRICDGPDAVYFRTNLHTARAIAVSPNSANCSG